MHKDSNYEVGYGKPPRSGQFKKGESGNPKGRAKGVQNTMTYLEKAKNTMVAININGKRQNITMHEAIIMQIVSKAASGDRKSAQEFLKLVMMQEGKQEAKEDPAFQMTEDDYEIIQDIAKRVSKNAEQERK